MIFLMYTDRNLGNKCGDGAHGYGIMVGGKKSWIRLNLLIWTSK